MSARPSKTTLARIKLLELASFRKATFSAQFSEKPTLTPSVYAASRPELWGLEVEGVDFLGADIAHQEWRPLRSEAAPRKPHGHDATEVLQVSHPFQFTIRDAGAIDRRIPTGTGVEVNILVVGRPLCEAYTGVGQLRPSLRSRVEEH